MNYGTLQARISTVIGREPPEICYELVTADVNQTMRLRVMEATATVSDGTLPTDFLQVITVHIDQTPRVALEQVDLHTFNERYRTGTTPTHFAIADGAILTHPDASADLILRYYARVPELSATDTNDVLSNYPSIYVYGVLAHHAALIRDEKAAALHFAAYEKAKAQASADDRKSRYGGPSPKAMVRTAP